MNDRVLIDAPGLDARPQDAPAPSAARGIVNAMTVDVEDYFHVTAFDAVLARAEWDRLESRVCRNTERLLECFDRNGVKATFFVLGWVAERFPALVSRIAQQGHEVASHGYAHHLVYDQTMAAFREDVRRAKGLLESIIGAPVDGYRAPSFSITERSLWALDILVEEGHRYDASIFPIHHDRYGIPDAPRHPHLLRQVAGTIAEVPGSTVQIGPLNLPVAGGGYFRLLPYAWTRWGISRVNARERRPAVFYIHPWETDPGQPRFRPDLWNRFRHYRNLDRTIVRLERLLRDFPFAPLGQVLTGLDLAPVGRS